MFFVSLINFGLDTTQRNANEARTLCLIISNRISITLKSRKSSGKVLYVFENLSVLLKFSKFENTPYRSKIVSGKQNKSK